MVALGWHCTIYHIFQLCAQDLVINKLFLRSTVGEASVKISKSYYNYQPSLVTARGVNTVTRSVTVDVCAPYIAYIPALCTGVGDKQAVFALYRGETSVK